MKFLAVVNSICLVILIGVSYLAVDRLASINHALWYQVSLIGDKETYEEYLGTSGLREPNEEWPYWNMAVQGNSLSGDLFKIGYLTKRSSCQIQPKDICTEIAYIWRKFGTIDASRAKFEARFYTHISNDSRGSSGPIEIQPRYQ